jgi:hypothetical protein
MAVLILLDKYKMMLEELRDTNLSALSNLENLKY